MKRTILALGLIALSLHARAAERQGWFEQRDATVVVAPTGDRSMATFLVSPNKKLRTEKARKAQPEQFRMIAVDSSVFFADPRKPNKRGAQASTANLKQGTRVLLSGIWQSFSSCFTTEVIIQ